jgi:hypothetical protein
MRRSVTATWLGVMMGLGACAEPGEPQTASQSTVSGGDAVTIGSPEWSQPAEGAVVLAHVGEVPITRDMVLRAKEASHGLDQRAALERLIDLEVLAQHGQREGLYRSARVRQGWRQSLVQRFLRGGFEPDVKPESLSVQKVQELYYVPDIRKLYDHADAWRMAHVFFTCCDPKFESCDQPEILQCFAESAETIQEVYSELKTMTAGLKGDVEKITAVMEAYRSDNENRFLRHPFAYRTRAFYYDPKKPHDEQKGYDIIAEGVARTVIAAQLGIVQEPIQSPFGWHVIVKLGHVPEDRRTADDPTVIADIRQNMLPKMREARFKGLLGKLAQDEGVEMYPAPLEHLNVRFNARL